MAQLEVPTLRTSESKTWYDEVTGRFRREHVLKTILHYPTAGPDSAVLDGEVDFMPQHITAGGRDLYRITQAGWHYAVGKDIAGIFANIDGVIGFGGRQGQHWLKSRLQRVGYLHWPTREWQDIGSTPTYDRADLSREVGTLTIGPEGAEQMLNVQSAASWRNIWNTPGGGAVDISWHVEGRQLKEEIVVNRAAREWIRENASPTTPLDETWFGFMFRLDVSDIPRWVIKGVPRDIEGDFSDDDGDIEIRDAADRLLGFMPVSTAYSEEYDAGEQDTVRLRKRIWKESGNYYLLIGARVDQLRAMYASAVTFDPTWDSSVEGWGDKDTHLNVGNPNKHFGSDIVLRMWTGYTGLIEFDISSIPSTATCSSATLSFWTADTKPGDRTLNVFELLAANEDWAEGANADPETTGNSTYDHRRDYNGGAPGDVNWAGSAGCNTSGTDYVAGTIGTGSYTANDPVGTLITISLTAGDVEDWFGASNENYGLRLKQNGGNFPLLDSSDSATVDERPKLVVEWVAAPAAIAMPVFAMGGIHSIVFGGQVVR